MVTVVDTGLANYPFSMDLVKCNYTRILEAEEEDMVVRKESSIARCFVYRVI